MSKLFTRTILFAGIACILLAALPAGAGQAPQSAVAGVAASAAAPLTPGCKLDVASTFASPAPAISTPALPEWLAVGDSPSVKFTGYCPCGCSSIKNCNTNADCGGATCSKFISCC
jgi:hypothetical protein